MEQAGDFCLSPAPMPLKAPHSLHLRIIFSKVVFSTCHLFVLVGMSAVSSERVNYKLYGRELLSKYVHASAL